MYPLSLPQLEFSHFAQSVSVKLDKENPMSVIKIKKSANLSNIVRNTSTRSKSKITASGLKNIAEEQGTSTRGGTVKLQTGSKPIPVVIGAPQIKPKQAKFSHENLKRLQAATNLSDKSMKYVFSEVIKIFSWYFRAKN